MVHPLILFIGLWSSVTSPQFTSRVSLDDGGLGGAGASVNPALSSSGRHVAFQSSAPLDPNASGFTDVYVRDRTAGTISLLSLSYLGGPANSNSTDSTLSDDGRYVAFQSNAGNLVAGDLNGFGDVFLADRDPDANGTFDEGNSTLIRLSVNGGGIEGNGPSSLPVLSGDGRYVTFISIANNLVATDVNGMPDQFVYEIATGNLTMLSLASNGSQGNLPSGPGVLSQDGRFLSFTTQATNFDVADTNGLPDIYLHDRDPDGNSVFDEGNGTTTWVSYTSGGGPANASCSNADLSANGNGLVFQSAATNLTPSSSAGISQIYYRQLSSGQLTLISRNLLSQVGNDASTYPEISFDGRAVVFQSRANNLVSGDTNNWDDAFLIDLFAHTMERISVTMEGNEIPLYSQRPTIGATKAEIAFQSPDDTIVPHDTNGELDIFVRGAGNWSPQLLVNTLQLGTLTWAMTCNGVPSETVWFLYSFAGLGVGPCPPALGGLCLDLLNPVSISGSAVTDPDGTATLIFTVPNNAPLIDVYVQAVVQRGVGNTRSVKSNAVTGTITP
ncbi:MAG: hypothetical protein H8E15_09205 [Planctomycetes bacterium]|nr:hypothetical protein [Planctomycetota bacterium]